MKTLILYATKHGTTHEIARRIAGQTGDATVHNLKQRGAPALDSFDRIIIGGSIYAGMMRKEAKTFLSRNADVLRRKELGLFLCCLDAYKQKEYFDTNIPSELLQSAKATAFLGGIFDPEKSSFMERFIMKLAAKQPKYINNIDDVEIRSFVERMSKPQKATLEGEL